MTLGGKLLNMVNEGECFGEMAYIRGGEEPRHATVEAMTDLIVAEFEPETLEQMSLGAAAAPDARAGAQHRRPAGARQHPHRALGACSRSRSRSSRAGMGEQLAGLVAGRGGVPFHAPALAELPDLDPQAIGALVLSLEKRPAKLAIFQTGVGTKALFAATDALALTDEFLASLKDPGCRAAAPSPRGALRQRGVRIDYSAADPFTTHELLDELGGLRLQGERVIVQRYGSVNRELDAALAARGAEVIEIPTYRWSLPQDTAPLEELVGAPGARRDARGGVHQRRAGAQPVSQSPAD